MTYQHLRLLAAATNLLMLAALLAGIFLKHRSQMVRLRFFIRSGLAVLATYFLAHFNRWWHLWKHHESFPSGHMTFFLCAATSLFLLYRRSWLVTLPAGIAYGWLIVFLGYHPWLDIYGAWLMAPFVTLLCHDYFRARGKT